MTARSRQLRLCLFLEIAVDQVAAKVGDRLHEKRLSIGAERLGQNDGDRKGAGVCAGAEDRRLRVEEKKRSNRIEPAAEPELMGWSAPNGRSGCLTRRGDHRYVDT